ncbi:MAG: hypothetical protein WDW36_003896 [Sanguina aurantia]
MHWRSGLVPTPASPERAVVSQGAQQPLHMGAGSEVERAPLEAKWQVTTQAAERPSQGMHYAPVVRPVQLTPHSASGLMPGDPETASRSALSALLSVLGAGATNVAPGTAAAAGGPVLDARPGPVKTRVIRNSRYPGLTLLTAAQLPRTSPTQGPAVWQVSGPGELAAALVKLLNEPLERRSRGHAAATAAAHIADSLVGSVWAEVERVVLGPAMAGSKRA